MPAPEVVMTGLSALWLPILLSAILVFVASSIIHMASPWHKSDYLKLRPSSRQDLQSPEFAAKLKAGPVAMITVMPNGPMSMARNLSLWFVYCLAVGVFAAYVTGRALPPGVA